MAFKICSAAIFSSICESIQANFTSLVAIDTSLQYQEENSADSSNRAKPAGHKTQSSDVASRHVSHVSKQSLQSPFSVANWPLGHDS